MQVTSRAEQFANVALFTRAWIEIEKVKRKSFAERRSPSSRGRGLKSLYDEENGALRAVALFTRAWIEMIKSKELFASSFGRPLHEGVD